MPNRNGGNPQDNSKKLTLFIPNLFKPPPSLATKADFVESNEPFITKAALEEYCSIYSNSESGLPKYLARNEKFLQILTDFPDDFFEDINEVQIERERKQNEEEMKQNRLQEEKEEAEKKIKQKLDKEVSKIIGGHKAFVKRFCPVRIPYKTTLSRKEHSAYLRSFIKFQTRPPMTAIEEQEYQYYRSLQNRVVDEQSCLMNFSYQVALTQLKEYNMTPENIEDYIKEYVKYRCDRSLAYPADYIQERVIPLKPHGNNSFYENLDFIHLGHLLSLGDVPWLTVPNIHFLTKFPMDETVKHRCPPEADIIYDRSKYLYKIPVSVDPNAQQLAQCHHADIVISASAFKTLVDNHGHFNKTWNIPVKIKSHSFTDEKSGRSKSKRIIYIDKPLVKKKWHSLEKKETFFKKTMFGVLIKKDRKPYKLYPAWETIPISRYEGHQEIVYDDDALFDVGHEEVEEMFGMDFVKRERKKESGDGKSGVVEKNRKEIASECEERRKEAEAEELMKLHSELMHKLKDKDSTQQLEDDIVNSNNTATNEAQATTSSQATEQTSNNNSKSKKKPKEDHNSGLLDSLLDEQKSFLSPKFSPMKGKTAKNSPNNIISNKTDAHPWDNTISSKWKLEQVRKCPNGSFVNVHYQIFSLESSNIDPDKDKQKPPIKVIVRSNLHAIKNEVKGKGKGNGTYKAFILRPKVENQAFFGCEVHSLSEITEQWADLVVRPHTHLMEARVCVESGSIILCEEKTLSSVLKEGKQQHIAFQPYQALASLQSVFSLLQATVSGDYLLHHSPKTQAFVNLMRVMDHEKDKFSSQPKFNLHSLYSSPNLETQAYSTPPWLAIDTHILTPFHLKHLKIPATFPMDNKREATDSRETLKKKKALYNQRKKRAKLKKNLPALKD